MARHLNASAAGLVLVGAVVWVLPMGRSLWLDETLTWWVVQGDLGQAISRAFEYQQSPLYYALVWPFAHIAGANEIWLRVPSVLAAIVTASLVWRLARRLIGADAGGVAVLALMGTWTTIEAYDARPYALALAFAAGATLALVHTLDHARVRTACVYGLLIAGMVWAHYLFAVILVPHAVYAAVRRRDRSTEVGWRLVLVSAAVGLLLLAPLAAQIASLWSRRQTLATGGTSPLVAPLLIANLIVVPASVVALIARRGRVSFAWVRLRDAGAVLLVGWSLLPPLVLWVVSSMSAPYFLNGRYLVSATPGVALMVAWGVVSLRPASARRAFVVALAVGTAFVFTLWFHREDDWRGAIATAASVSDEDTLVLARVRLVEAKQVDWLTDPERRSYLLAPFAVYVLGADPVPLPLFPHDPGADVYLDALLGGPVAATDRFVLIEQGSVYRAWLQERLGPLGWSSRTVGTVEEPEATEFTRAPPSTPIGPTV